MGDPSSQEPGKTPRLRFYLCKPRRTAFHDSYGIVEVQDGQVIELQVRDGDLQMWWAATEVLRTKIRLRLERLKAEQGGLVES